MEKKLCQHKAFIEELTWHDVKDEVASVNPKLAEILNQLKPGKGLTLFKAKYPFGAKILENGIFYLPAKDGSVVSVYDPQIPNTMREKLAYNPVPVALVLKNTCEVFADSENRFIPFKIFMPGEIFGTWELVDPKVFKQQAQNWDFKAGVRSIFMLPKISEHLSHARLRHQYGVRLSAPKYLSEHHQVFTKIANHPEFSEEWYNEIIFFPEDWLIQAKHATHSWIALNYFLLQETWIQSLIWRSQVSLELIWQSLSQEIDKRNMKPRHYLVNTVKHLIMIGIGSIPAFAPALDSICAPIKGLQAVYQNEYGLKYTPTIMIPQHLSKKTSPVYYSLQCPTLLSYSPMTSHVRSAMHDLQEIEYLMTALLEKLKKNKAPLYQLVKNIQFHYYHTELDPHHVIQSAQLLAEEDLRFSQVLCKTTRAIKKIAESASFLRGCIRISFEEK